jgi:hypothetical protein
VAASKSSSGLHMFLAKSDVLPSYVLLLLLLKNITHYEHVCCVLWRRCGNETAKIPPQHIPLCAALKLPILAVIFLAKMKYKT